VNGEINVEKQNNGMLFGSKKNCVIYPEADM
jgi:hypothetical protein